MLSLAPPFLWCRVRGADNVWLQIHNHRYGQGNMVVGAR